MKQYDSPVDSRECTEVLLNAITTSTTKYSAILEVNPGRPVSLNFLILN